jgi:hypothetical protein
MEKKLNVFLIQKKIQKNFKKISKKDSVKLFSQYIIIYIYMGSACENLGGLGTLVLPSKGSEQTVLKGSAKLLYKNFFDFFDFLG